MAQYLKEILFSLICPENNWKTDLLNKWKDIIGPLYTKVCIERIHNDTIVLGVFNSCWLQELYLLSPLLIKTINEKLDQPYIKQIRFKHISPKQQKYKKIKTPLARKKLIELTKQDEGALAKIVDPALYNALKAFRIRCYQES